jgi:chemotaxis protein methyltransferase CheR
MDMDTLEDPRSDIEDIEIDLLIEAIFRRYGHDFRHYARASVERRVRHFLGKSGCGAISEMIPRLLRDEAFFSRMLSGFSVTVTEMFRDPFVYASIRKNVIPVLKTFPFVRIWHAGCATGEEAYSLAVLLTEEGIYGRSTVFATDFNDHALETARHGIYDLDNVKQYTKNYQAADGTGSFSGYYHARYGAMALDGALKRNITFANHNLATDAVFGEMHLIVCRNVLIYFDKQLQDRVFRIFEESLVRGGFLCLGTKETPAFSSVKDRFEAVDRKARIFRKTEGLW